MYRNVPDAVHLKDYRPPEYLIDRAELTFELDVETTVVGAILALRRNPAAVRGDGDLRLDGELLQLEHIAIDGRELVPSDYRLDGDSLLLHLSLIHI